MREIVVKNKKLKELLAERAPLVQEGRDLQDEMERMKEEFQAKVDRQNEVAKKLNKIKDKVVPILAKLTEGQLGEFEDTREAEIRGEEVVIHIGDHLEDFKERFKKQNKR